MLSASVRDALDRRLQGVSRRELAKRAQALSEHYRAGKGTQTALHDDLDALAYAVVRMPATFAAASAALRAVRQRWPVFAPRTVLDLGAGPGSATLAALEVWPGIAEVCQVEPNAAMRSLSADLCDAAIPQVAIRRAADKIDSTDLGRQTADLVVAAYLLVELGLIAAEQAIMRALESCTGALVLIEPGTPSGFAAIDAARTRLIASGARVVAPCPGEMACPMSGADWCHFSIRLARSRDHKLVKGADVPYEDERYSFIAVTRSDEPRAATARVLAEPDVDRAGISLKLCTLRGLRQEHVSKRDKPAFRGVRKLAWGDEAPD